MTLDKFTDAELQKELKERADRRTREAHEAREVLNTKTMAYLRQEPKVQGFLRILMPHGYDSCKPDDPSYNMDNCGRCYIEWLLNNRWCDLELDKYLRIVLVQEAP